MKRAIGAICLVVVVLVMAAMPAGAASPHYLSSTLGSYWARILALPTDQNPFGNSSVSCVHYRDPLGRPTLSAVVPAGTTTAPTCSMPFGTNLFVFGWTSECSTAETAPFGGPNLSHHKLQACAEAADAGMQPPTATLDGRPLPLTEVESPPINVVLGENNLFGLDPGKVVHSAAHGWVAAVPLLLPGQHTITLDVHGDYVPAPNRIDQTL